MGRGFREGAEWGGMGRVGAVINAHQFVDASQQKADLAASRRSSSLRALYTLGPSACTTLSSLAMALAFFFWSLVMPGDGGVMGGGKPRPLAGDGAPLPPACMKHIHLTAHQCIIMHAIHLPLCKAETGLS